MNCNTFNKIRSAILILLLSLVPSTIIFAQDQGFSEKSASLEQWKALKYGMFIHWGDFSALGGIYHGEKIAHLGEQIQRHAEAPTEEYELTVRDFNPVDFNADEWVSIARNAGMKYMVITAKHHNGFCIWDTKTTDYNIVDATPFNRDPIKELADACKRAGLGFGVYYSTIDWHYPGSVERAVHGQFSVNETIPEAHHRYSLAQLQELCSGRYGDLVQVFFDMGLPTPRQSQEMRNVVKSLQPDCQINGRIMNNMGDFLTMPDNAVPNAPIPQAWEAPSTLYNWSTKEIPGWSNEWWNTWGYKSWIPTPPLAIQVKKQLRKMAVIVSRGGNFLLNVGPDGTGRIIPYEQNVLKEMSNWLKDNGEAIYGSSPTPFTRNPDLICTRKPGKLYFFLIEELKGNALELPGLKSEISRAYMLTDPEQAPLTFTRDNEVTIHIPKRGNHSGMEVVVVEYDGALEVVTPVVEQVEDHSINLTYEAAYITGSYDSESYRSLANDTHCNWDVHVRKKGEYHVRLALNSKLAATRYTLQVGLKQFSVEVKDNQMEGEVGSVKLDKSEKLNVSVFPAESKKIFSNGYTGFNNLMLEDVTVTLIHR